MECYFRYSCKSRSKESVNLDIHFDTFFLNGLITDRPTFEKILEKQAEFVIPGKHIGQVVRQDATYETYYVEDLTEKCINRYLKNFQIFLKFFIETGSYVDDTDPMWKHIFMIEKVESCDKKSEHRTFVGFVSYYPFFKELDKYRVRISQQVILPCFQRKGLGSHLLNVHLIDRANLPALSEGSILLRNHSRSTI